MDALEIWAIFSDAPLVTGGFTNEGMIFEFKISAGTGSKFDSLKPSAMGWQVEQTIPGIFQDCWGMMRFFIRSRFYQNPSNTFWNPICLEEGRCIRYKLGQDCLWGHTVFKFIKKCDKLWVPCHQRDWFSVVLFKKFPQCLKSYLKIWSIVMVEINYPNKGEQG